MSHGQVLHTIDGSPVLLSHDSSHDLSLPPVALSAPQFQRVELLGVQAARVSGSDWFVLLCLVVSSHIDHTPCNGTPSFVFKETALFLDFIPQVSIAMPTVNCSKHSKRKKQRKFRKQQFNMIYYGSSGSQVRVTFTFQKRVTFELGTSKESVLIDEDTYPSLQPLRMRLAKLFGVQNFEHLHLYDIEPSNVTGRRLLFRQCEKYWTKCRDNTESNSSTNMVTFSQNCHTTGHCLF